MAARSSTSKHQSNWTDVVIVVSLLQLGIDTTLTSAGAVRSAWEMFTMVQTTGTNSEPTPIVLAEACSPYASRRLQFFPEVSISEPLAPRTSS